MEFCRASNDISILNTWNGGISKTITAPWQTVRDREKETEKSQKDANKTKLYYIVDSSVYNILAVRLNWSNGTLMPDDVIAIFLPNDGCGKSQRVCAQAELDASINWTKTKREKIKIHISPGYIKFDWKSKYSMTLQMNGKDIKCHKIRIKRDLLQLQSNKTVALIFALNTHTRRK